MIKSAQSKKYSYSYSEIFNFCREVSESSDNNSESSFPKPVVVVSSESSIDVGINLDGSVPGEQQCKSPVKFDLDQDDINNNVFSIFDTVYSTDNRMYLYQHFGLER